METEPLVREIVETLEEIAEPARKEMMNHYCPTSMRVLGVSNPDLRLVIRELRTRHRQWPPRRWIELCKALVATGIFECQGLAIERIARERLLLESLDPEDLEGLEGHLDNWASVDHFAVGIYGVLWRLGTVSEREVHRKLRSRDPWQRRVAVVSTVSLNLKSRGGAGDPVRTLAICEKVVDDHHDMIQKALSWSLRELSKRDREVVRAFLEKYRPRLAGRVIREVQHMLDHGTKN